MAAVRARRSLAEMDGWLPPSGRRTCARARRWRGASRRYPGAVARSGRARRRAAPSTCGMAKPAAAQAAGPRTGTPRSAGCASCAGAAPTSATPAPASSEAARAARARAAGHRGEGLPGYFLIVHDIVAFAREPRHPLPGPGLGGQLGGLLRARHHRGRPDLLRPAVRAVPLRAPRRGARHRRRLRLRPARGGHPVRSTTRYGRRNAAQVANVISYRPQIGGPRHGQGARLLHRPAGRLVQADRRLESGRSPTERPTHDIPAPVVELADRAAEGARGTSASTPAAWCSPSGRSARCARSSAAGWTTAPCCSGTRTPARAMGLVKFDLLGLGMLGALQYTLRPGRATTSASTGRSRRIPKEEPGVYDMLCRADSIGVFQVESRAQIGTLPRLQPRRFYDLVDRDRADPARPDPGRRGAPLHPPGAPGRSRSPTCTRRSSRCWSGPWACRCSRSS